MRTALLIAAVLLALPSAQAADGDVAGGQDHPVVGRFDGSVITYFDLKDFDAFTVALAPTKTRTLGESQTVEGETWRIAYRLDSEQSLVEVERNFVLRLEAAGFETLFECADKACGLTGFRYAIETIATPHMQVDAFNYRYRAMAREADGVTTTVTLLFSTNNKKVFTQTVVVESGELADRMIDAQALAESISSEGRVVIYGIYFDFDSAVIKSESRPTLDEIGKLLGDRPEQRVMIVGHTDNQGSLDYNRELSLSRAQAVSDDLVATYGIKADRVVPAGVGFLAPIASNSTEAGRAQNRRVELVDY